MDRMPKGGAKELMKSRYGREYLGKLQERHKVDILQPTDPLFQKVYGDKLGRDAEAKRRAEDKAREEWERSVWEKKNENRHICKES